jgi:AbrB family looped-hinge helix DNA binding protein
MNTVKLQQRGIITLPKKIRTQLDLHEGQVFQIESQDGQIILAPQLSLNEQLARDIKRGLEDIKAGNYIEFSTIEEFDEKIKAYGD